MILALQGLFDVVDLPLIEIVPPDDGGEALTSALADIERFAWVIVTSANGADAVVARWAAAGAVADDGRARPTRFAAIGDRTAATLTDAGIGVDFVPSRFEPHVFVDEFPRAENDADTVLLARAAAASQVLPAGLAAKGWLVEDIDAYRSMPTSPNADDLDSAVDADIVSFTAPSAVARFRELLGVRRCNATIASIGPVTSEAAARHGFEVTIEPDQHTTADLVAAIKTWSDQRGS